MAKIKAHTMKPGSKKEVSKAKFSATSKAVDPGLAALFASSLGPVKQKPTPPQEAVFEESVASSANEVDDEEEGGNSASENQLGQEEDASSDPEEQTSFGQPIFQALEGRNTSIRKRKRGGVEDDVEGAYMQRLAREEAREEKKRRLENGIDASASIVGNGKGQQNADTDKAESELGSNDIITDAEEDNVRVPQHESLAPSQKEVELERASRTVFLANVSTSAIKSKTSRKTLLDHLGSFTPSLTTHTPPHKVESLRFRSTAFASSAVPKKAAYARKELMDATTKSTNAYAVYTTPLAAREATKRLNGTMVLDRHLRVDSVAHPSKQDHRRCIFVGNLGFVDDESSINAAADEESGKKPRKAKEPADIEEGLWRQFSKAGTVESVRVVRDKTTRVGKGFAYVQFQDANAVETALLYNEKKYPPMLPRILRVTRAKDPKKTASYSQPGKAPNRDVRPAKARGIYTPKVSSQTQSLAGRAGKLLGRAGAAQFNSADKDRGPNKKINGTAKTPGDIVFEGYRASSKQGKGTLKLGGSGKKQGKPRTRSSKRGAAFRAGGGKKEPPKIHLDEVFSSSMSLNGLNGLLSEPVTPSRQKGSSPTPSIGAQRYASHGSDTPIRIHSTISNGVNSTPASESGYFARPSPTVSALGSPSGELQGIPWSSAVGRATTGKSGRVIERLMADNDRLQRELTLSNAKMEEEAKRSEWAKSTLESLRATNENLLAMQEVDKAALLRKDRKIEELRADLEAEKVRRAQAENETRETVTERDEAVGKYKKQIIEEKELAKKSTIQYEILSSSWRSLDDGYRKRTQKLKTDVRAINEKREDDVQKIEQLEVVVEQLRRESEKMQKVKEQVMRDFEDYKSEKEVGMREIKERAERNEAANEEVLVEMNRVMGEMKYVINIRKDVRGAE